MWEGIDYWAVGVDGKEEYPHKSLDRKFLNINIYFCWIPNDMISDKYSVYGKYYEFSSSD